MAHFTVGDLRSKLGGRQAPVEDDQPGAGARASEQGEIEVEAVLPHEADQLAGACDAVREIIGNPRAGAVELGKSTIRVAVRSAARLGSCRAQYSGDWPRLRISGKSPMSHTLELDTKSTRTNSSHR